jgi:hypothetical protein
LENCFHKRIEGEACIGKAEHFYIEKEFKGKTRADKVI